MTWVVVKAVRKAEMKVGMMADYWVEMMVGMMVDY